MTSAADLLIGQITYHFDKVPNWEECRNGDRPCMKEFNDNQELIGISTDKWTFIYMHQNSIREKSFIAARTYKIGFNEYLSPYIAIGAATGYSDVYPNISYEKLTVVGYAGIDIHPKSDNVGLLITWQYDSFVGLGLRFKLP